MASRALSASRLAASLLGLAAALGAGCGAVSVAADSASVIQGVDASFVPPVTVSATSSDLVLANGIYLYRGRPFDGFIEEQYPGGALKGRVPYFDGMRHGVATTFYPDGRLRDTRSYRGNLSYDRHVGYWNDGRIRFDFTYVDEKREGLQRQWYRSGKPYTALMFKDDKEDGRQRAWRENGKLYINYEARDGFRYGLQKSALCYEIADGAI
jgi:hypothetical protein